MAERVPVREDFLDYPTAWAIQREMGEGLPHLDVRCSAVPKPYAERGSMDAMAGPAFLCDCGAVIKEWELRVQQQRQAREDAAYQHMVDNDNPFGGTHEVQAQQGYSPDL